MANVMNVYAPVVYDMYDAYFDELEEGEEAMNLDEFAEAIGFEPEN